MIELQFALSKNVNKVMMKSTITLFLLLSFHCAFCQDEIDNTIRFDLKDIAMIQEEKIGISVGIAVGGQSWTKGVNMRVHFPSNTRIRIAMNIALYSPYHPSQRKPITNSYLKIGPDLQLILFQKKHLKIYFMSGVEIYSWKSPRIRKSYFAFPFGPGIELTYKKVSIYIETALNTISNMGHNHEHTYGNSISGTKFHNYVSTGSNFCNRSDYGLITGIKFPIRFGKRYKIQKHKLNRRKHKIDACPTF